MVLSGAAIQARGDIITPFYGRTRHNGMTFGCGPAGYDVRIEWDDRGEDPFRILKPGAFLLGSTIEKFKMPKDVIGIVHDKSTWIRRGISVHNTVIEPGWNGFLTLEIKNVGDNILEIKTGDPIAQIIFHEINGPTSGYEGKYQNQERGPQEAREDN